MQLNLGILVLIGLPLYLYLRAKVVIGRVGVAKIIWAIGIMVLYTSYVGVAKEVFGFQSNFDGIMFFGITFFNCGLLTYDCSKFDQER